MIGALVGSVWGTMRHTIRASISNKHLTFQSNTLKRGLLSGLGAASIIAFYKLDRWFYEDFLLLQYNSTLVRTMYDVGSSIYKVVVLYYLLPLAPFSLVPGLFGIIQEQNRKYGEKVKYEVNLFKKLGEITPKSQRLDYPKPIKRVPVEDKTFTKQPL